MLGRISTITLCLVWPIGLCASSHAVVTKEILRSVPHLLYCPPSLPLFIFQIKEFESCPDRAYYCLLSHSFFSGKNIDIVLKIFLVPISICTCNVNNSVSGMQMTLSFNIQADLHLTVLGISLMVGKTMWMA